MTTLAEIEAAAPALKSEEREHLESLLRELREKEHEAYLQSLYERAGFFPLPKKSGGKPVTTEIVRQLREEDEFERYQLSQKHSVLDILPISLGKILHSLSPDDDLLGEMLEGRV